ncbi:SDR family NAD(P)-dependent oxidoreductase [Zhouia sp. PK063]|uniref:SDR family NAD(P)-dependent oxidoreductase n=1 Tax=Zhouia sp. PK063 TaxID=3373602 RepID=UPI00379E057B
MKEQNYALVTGASRGLGRAYAFELAKRNYNLIMVSLPDDGLEEIANNIQQQYKVDVVYFEKDLTQKEDILNLAIDVNQNYNLNMLINNVGFGGGRHFLEVSSDYIDRMIQLNVRATALITHELLPNLIQRKKAFVLNVSSMAGMSPIGYKTVYPATKAFVYSFSRSLEKEFADTNVHFGVVSPGPMMTNDDVIKRMEYQGYIVRKAILSPEKVAFISIKKLLKGKNIITLTGFHKVQWALLHIVPVRFKMSILSKIAKNEVLSES